MRVDLKRYLKNCEECGRVKARRHKDYGLLHPLPVPNKLWDEISMDFITDLPVSDGFDTVWVIKDRLGKRAHFVSCISTMTTQDLVQFVRKQASLPIVTDLSGNRRGRSKGSINVLECNPGDYKRKL